MLYKLIRVVVKKVDQLRSTLLITYFKILYPGCTIYNTYLSRGVKVVCTDGSKLIIEESSIGSGSVITAAHGATIHISKSYIGLNCVIIAREHISIGSHCQIAEMVVIRDQNHRFGEPGKTIEEQGFTSEPIHIGRNVWLAAKVTVVAGATIEDNVVVGAHSLVRGRLLANSLYAGVPARCIRSFAAQPSDQIYHE
jgi:acetyltransferase-like isoleucine patch superfamily enzyme